MYGYLKEHFDARIAAATLALVTIGVISVYSATYDAKASEIFYRQILWVGVGSLAFIVMTFLPYRVLQFVAWPSYFFTIFLLVAVLVVGHKVSGSTSWFNLGSMRLQPAEFAKITTVLALGAYLSRSDVTVQNIRSLAIASAIVVLPVILILLQPDTGTAIVFVAMYLPVLYWAGATRFTLAAIIAPPAAAFAALFGTTPFLIVILVFGIILYVTKENRIVAAVVFSIMVMLGISVQFFYDHLKPYQQKRIATFLDPAADPLGAGYNILQSKVAIGSGGLFGKGYLQGTQTQLNFIPQQWTDFIFCVPGEEFGFVGSAVVLLLFMALLFRGVGVASSVKNKFGSVAAIGTMAILATHVAVNIGMALGLLPVIGVPLPFLSYGGSALLAAMCMAGLLMNLYANRKEY